MPTLDWIGRKAVEKHHTEVPFHLLNVDPKLSVGDLDSGNLLIQADNLLALKALLPYYAGQVKCIYIDPPYNTGNENWIYNDNVNSPQIREWLGKVVGSEGEDLSRHDKWLCMMYPRLNLLWQLLSDDGSFWMSIDDNEVHHARALLDEIFSEQNFIACVIWQKMFSPKSSARHLSENHDYVLVYAKKSSVWERNLLTRMPEHDKRYKNPDDDPRGLWTSGDLSARNYYGAGTYPITCPSGRVIAGPPKGMYWRFSKESFDELNRDERIWWGRNGDNVPRLKRFLSDVKEGIVPQTIWFHQEVGNTQEAKKEIVSLLQDAAEVFLTPKPTRLIERILQIATNPGDLVLDSFSGSGTTGHAVLKMNHVILSEATPGGLPAHRAGHGQNLAPSNETLRHTTAQGDITNRRFILVEIEPEIARNITAERLKRVIEGYTYKDQRDNDKHEASLGGSFRFCTLGPTLFDADGRIRDEVKFDELARHVFFAETGTPLPKRTNGKTPLLGVYNGTAIYLLYNGILNDKQPRGGNVLTQAVLANLPPHAGPKIIYGTSCRLSAERLRREGLTFRQIPYEVKTR